jgi:DNA-binding NarL/FixJ family response regulator
LLRDIVKLCIGDDREFEIIAQLSGSRRVESLRALRPDVVIVALRRNEGADVAKRLLDAFPNARIVALSPDYRTAQCSAMRPCQSVLSDFSPSDLGAFIRCDTSRPVKTSGAGEDAATIAGDPSRQP